MLTLYYIRNEIDKKLTEHNNKVIFRNFIISVTSFIVIQKFIDKNTSESLRGGFTGVFLYTSIMGIGQCFERLIKNYFKKEDEQI